MSIYRSTNVWFGKGYVVSSDPVGDRRHFNRDDYGTVKPLIKNTSEEFIKCRFLNLPIMECRKYLVFLIKYLYGAL